MGLHDRAFRALLRLLPAEFRGDYERELSATFRAQRHEAHGRGALLRLWLATIGDVFRTAPGEHLDILRRDLAYAARMLARRPALTFTAIVTLALGIGVNTAIFSVIDGVLFAPLPYPEAERLVRIQEARLDDEPGTTGYASFAALRAENKSLASIAAYGSGSAIFAGDGKEPERVVSARVSWNYFRTLGLRPALGRDFDEAEDHPERRRVAIISDALWRRRYAANPDIIGQPVTINSVAYTLAGVMPPGLTELVSQADVPEAQVWTVLGYAETLPQACATCRHLRVVGRLRPGVTMTQAEADLTRIYQSLAARSPTEYNHPRAVLTTIRAYLLASVRTPLYLLWAAVGLLLLMACANIANLLLIRASERDEEIAIRRALGVSPARMLRQLVTEAVVLALLGGAAGIALAWLATSLIVANGPDEIPRLDAVTVNGRVLLYALLVSLGTGLLFGMAPARVLVDRDRGRLLPGERRTTAGPTAWKYRAALVATNVALSTLLLVGSGLLVRSFVRLLAVDPGFDPRGLLTMQVDLSGEAYREIAGVTDFYDRVIARISAIAGVDVVTLATQLPLTGSVDQSGITIEGRPLENPAAAPYADRYAVRPGYFAALRIPLLGGRVFTDADRAGSTPVAIVSRKMAEDLWPGENPIGRRIRVAGGAGNPMRTIVGIVGGVRHYGLHEPETMQVYIPHTQTLYPEPIVSIVVRTSDRDPLALAGVVREQIRGVDALQPVTRIQTYDAIYAQSLAARRFTLALLAAFAGTALLLAVVGLYGALGYVVRQREREIGVRVALGAEARQIVGLVVRQGMTPVVAGLGIGLAASLAIGRFVESLLYGTSARDAATFAAAGGVLALCALAASLLPARRAAAIDPAVTLRQ